MKARFNHWYNALLTALLGMLGYGCSSEEPMDMYGVAVAYGVPNANYIVKGTVTDEGGTPIQGIKASVKKVYPVNNDGEQYVYGVDSIQTDGSGNYKLSYNDYPRNTYNKLVVEDIDGEANGGDFKSDTLDIDYDKAVQTAKGDGFWNDGTFEINQDIKLKKK